MLIFIYKNLKCELFVNFFVLYVGMYTTIVLLLKLDYVLIWN